MKLYRDLLNIVFSYSGLIASKNFDYELRNWILLKNNINKHVINLYWSLDQNVDLPEGLKTVKFGPDFNQKIDSPECTRIII